MTRRQFTAGAAAVAAAAVGNREASAASASQGELHRLIAYVGSYKNGPTPGGGGVFSFEVGWDGSALTPLARVTEPNDAGYLVYAANTHTLYVANEHKNDGRGPVDPPAAVHAFSVSQTDGGLTWLNSERTPGANPSYLSVAKERGALFAATHGGFDHIEHVVKSAEGTWGSEYLYDDSTVIMFDLETDGRIAAIRDLIALEGHGNDPNTSPQVGGHAQASAHAHCVVVDPSEGFAIVCDKGTDQIFVYRLGVTLEEASVFRTPDVTGPRHIVFDPKTSRALMTCELSSELMSFDFDATTGTLALLDKTSTVADSFDGYNEPADLRLHPNGSFAYVNNRGEDSVAWFSVDERGKLTRLGSVQLAKSVHPGLAARSFVLDPTGTFMLVADRPANLVRSFAVNEHDGSLSPLTEISVPEPAFIVFAELPASA
ncbi:lactonase family protein [Consotaella aegiceratis]|uniref:lactonase family protein n=1 Tax=Consotaella aegiceratis TaxID=3097961 RepID=UPI002F408AE5